MSVTKGNTTRQSSIKKAVIVTKSKVPAKSTSVHKVEKVNKMLSKTKWLSSE